MFELYLQNKPHEDEYIGVFKNKEEIFEYIQKWLDRNKIYAYYFRSWKRDDRIYIDFGDWHKFFYYKLYLEDIDFLGRN